MILIALSWIYIILTLIPFGVLACKWFSIRNNSFPEVSLLGLFLVTVAASLWAFFGAIDIEFQFFVLVSAVFLFLRYKADVVSVYREMFERIRHLSPFLKIFFGANALIILGQSAVAPFVLDNESYYIQTIKWINEYGFVKGIANLHPFLAQQSGWHVAQSAYSFSFAYDRFNDLSGFCLLLGNWFAFYRLSDYERQGNNNWLIAGLLPLANVFFLRFSGAPSPDIPVYIFSFIIVDYFIQKFRQPDKSSFNLIVVLVLFTLYIKPLAIVLVLLPLFLFLNNKRIIGLKITAMALVGLSLFIAKNTIVSGHPFFPMSWLSDYAANYKVPQQIIDFYFTQTQIYGYELTEVQYNAATGFELFVRWLMLPNFHGWINRFTLLLVAAGPFFIWKLQNRKVFWVLYFVTVVQIILLLITAPQYRYYLNFVLIFGMFCLAVFPLSQKIWKPMLCFSTTAALLLLLFPIPIDAFTTNENAHSSIVVENIVFPDRNSRIGLSYQKIKKGNLEFYSPKEMEFFWATGDTPLPCVSQSQLNYLQTYYGVFPQMRTQNLKDGFYAEDAFKKQ